MTSGSPIAEQVGVEPVGVGAQPPETIVSSDVLLDSDVGQ
jgi:hypothetical protein